MDNLLPIESATLSKLRFETASYRFGYLGSNPESPEGLVNWYEAASSAASAMAKFSEQLVTVWESHPGDIEPAVSQKLSEVSSFLLEESEENSKREKGERLKLYADSYSLWETILGEQNVGENIPIGKDAFCSLPEEYTDATGLKPKDKPFEVPEPTETSSNSERVGACWYPLIGFVVIGTIMLWTSIFSSQCSK